MNEEKTVLDRAATVCGCIAVMVLGLSCGAMLTGAAVVVPYWRSLPAPDFLAWFAANAQRMQFFFGLLQSGAILFGVASAVLFGIVGRPGRLLFAIATVLAVAVLATYPVYFREANASFVAATIPLDQVAAELARWASWQWVRTTLGLAAFGVATVAVSRSGE